MKMKKKMGRKVSGKKYAEVSEEDERRMGDKDNHPARKPADIAQAFARSKKGMKKPSVKADKKKGVK